MIDRHYGHLANDSRDHAVALLDALAFERAVDTAWTSSHQQTTKKLVSSSSRGFVKPSDGLEPSTPSLPCSIHRKRWQSSATVSK